MLDPIGNVFLNLVLFRNPHFQKTLFNIGATIYPLLNSIAHSALEVEKKCNNKCLVCCYRYDLHIFEFFLYLSKVFGAIYYRKIKKSDFIF